MSSQCPCIDLSVPRRRASSNRRGRLAWLARSTAAAAIGVAALAAAGCADGPADRSAEPGSGELGVAAAALTSEQCSYWAVDDQVTFCHLANQKKGKYVLLRTNVDGCVSGHAGHDGDFVSLDGSCENDHCFPEGAPWDETIMCCDNMDVVDGHCACAAGYEAQLDGTCADIDGCAAAPCDPNATCTDVAAPGTGATCTCNDGYEAQLDGTCTDIDGCAAAPCDPNATCTDVAAPGTGATCACDAGYEGDGVSCADIDGCAAALCDPNATCTDVAAPGTGATCTCNDGYEGDGTTCTPTGPSCDPPSRPDSCVSDSVGLDDIGLGDFSIWLDMAGTTQTANPVELLSQRSSCSGVLCCGDGGWWSIRIVGGLVNFETYGGPGTYIGTRGTTDVKDGQPHKILVQRKSGVISITVDDACEPEASQSNYPPMFGDITATVGTDGCLGVDGTVPLDPPLNGYCVSVPQKACPAGSVAFEDSCYAVATPTVASANMWLDAENDCAARLGGHLVSIGSAAEQAFVFSLMGGGMIGFSDEGRTTNDFAWFDGSAVTYTNWGAGEPNNAGPKCRGAFGCGFFENCAQITSGGGWNDLPCTDGGPYTCEFAP